MKLKNLIASMESVDENGNPIDPDQNEEDQAPETGGDSLEAELAEVSEAAGEAEEAEDNVEELTEVAEGLESIANDIHASLESGGLDPVAARGYQHAINAHMARLGQHDGQTVSMEDFGGASSRHDATVSMEAGAREWLKRIWAAIKNAIAKARDALKAMWIKLFDAAPKLKRRAEALAAKAKGLKESKEKSIKIAGGVASDLAIGNTMVKSLGELTGQLRKVADGALVEFQQEAVAYGDGVTKLVKGAKFDTDEGFKKSIAGLGQISVPTFAGAKVASNDARFKGKTVERTDRLPGNKAIFISNKAKTGDSLEGYVDFYSTLRVEVLDFTPNGQSVNDQTMPLPSPADIAAAAKEIGEIAARIAGYNQKFKQTEAYAKGVVAAGDSFSAEADKSDKLSPESKRAAQGILRIAKNAAEIVDAGVGSIVRYVVATAGKSLVVAERAAAAYE